MIVVAYPEVREWMKYFDPHPGSSIIDLGCHAGETISHFESLGHFVAGVERDVGLCELYSGSVPLFNESIEDFEPSQTYDYVLLTEILEHVEDPGAVIDVAATCMNEESILYITVPGIRWGNETHLRGITPPELGDLLKPKLHPFCLFGTRMFPAKLPHTVAFARLT